MRKGIIYKCLIGSKVYIGQTIKTLDRRKKEHLRDSKNPNHVQYDTKFYKKLRESLEQIWEVIEELNESELNNREIYWIDKNDSFRNGYNSTLGGDGSRGFKHTEEHKEKLREAASDSNNKFCCKGKFGPTHPVYGRKHTEEWKRIVSERMKQNNPMKGIDPSKHPQAKINYDIAERIRKDYRELDITQQKLASKYNLGIRTIKEVLLNKRWYKYEQHEKSSI